MRKNFFRTVQILTCLLILLSGPFLRTVKAADYYPMSCNAYEVSYINDDGSFKKVECYSDFASANQKMKELGGDHVVRSANGDSPTRIVAMNSGYAYAYPGRGGDATLSIYEDISDRSIYTKRTYVSHYYEMYYHETSLVLSDGKRGMIHVTLNGFDGYTDLEYTDLVPSKYIDRGIAIWLGGKNSYYGEDPYRIVMKRNTYSVVQNGSYSDLRFTYHMAYPKSSSLQCLEYTVDIGPAPAFAKSGTNYYSLDGIHYYTDPALTKGAGTEYNYYQWLPLRSKTKITAAQIETYLKEQKYADRSVLTGKAQAFIDAQNKYGVNALLVYAMACHESDSGTSNFAVKRKNLFGWNAFDASPNSASSFSSVEQCVNEQMGINLRGYLDITDGRFFGPSLGNKAAGVNVKYASDPYWGMKIAAIAYRIDKSANHFNGQLTDYKAYDMALVKTFDASVYSAANDRNELFKTGYGGSYQKDFLVIPLGESGNYTKVQLPNGLNSKGELLTHRTPATTGSINAASEYSFDRSVGYLKTADLTPLTYEIVRPGKYVAEVSSMTIKDGILKISGKAYTENVPVTDVNRITNTLILSGPKEVTQELSTETKDGVSTFSGEIDLKDLDVGTYTFKITTEYSERGQFNDSFEVASVKQQPASAMVDGKVCSFTVANKKLTLQIKKVGSEDVTSVVSVRSLELTSGSLKLKGTGVLQGIPATRKEDVKYELVLYLIDDPEQNTVFPAATLENNGFSLNDGVDYTYSAYEGSVSLSGVKPGIYGLKLRISNGSYSAEASLGNSRVEYRSLYTEKDGLGIRLTANELYNYRFELEAAAKSLDYSAVKKPSARTSLMAFDKLTLSKDLQLQLQAHALMYYLAYPEIGSAEYKLWLIDEKGGMKEIAASGNACALDYTATLQSKYDLNGICFTASGSIEDLSAGDHQLVVTIRSGEYYDILPLSNRSFRTLPEVSVNGRKYSLQTSPKTARIYLHIEGE